MLISKRRKKVSNKSKQRPKKRRKPKKPRSEKMNVKLSILLYSLVIVLTSIYLLSRYAEITGLQKTVIEKENEIIELQDKKSELNLKLEEIKDSGWIEEQAKARMNMRKAKGDQIIYLDVK